MASDFQRNFLVTSVGAYDDSGLGTGGFTCIADGEAVIIDKIDSTALVQHGSTIYRFARGLQALIGYRVDGVRSMLKLPEVKDLHDILVRDGLFVCVSTGTNEVLWIDAFGDVARRWKCEGERDAWHVNCLCEAGGKLYLTAFGRFAEHRGWLGKCTETGFVVEVGTENDVVTGLSGPHNPRFIDGQWVICNSHARNLVLQAQDGTRRTVELEGFTRGFAHDEHFFYVGESANRKADVPCDYSFIAVVDRQSLQVVERIRVPFPEIYELITITPELAQQIRTNVSRFQIDSSAERIRALETQVELGYKEIESLKIWLEKARRPKNLQQALTEVKRSLVRSIGGKAKP
jgi:hypothetical protein